ncbi:TPA: hypothetical protein N0F65_012970 [Lagenidium giganteum]|uniref:CCHC-type domain-containing protein n=1 Tax=Lagenidium giganteum TaxID=4803 RepID=A0AAV2Z4G0_9STRA|nr:TPA: hypothetical protein N0F65_012970 [Lagenidium giganteum]
MFIMVFKEQGLWKVVNGDISREGLKSDEDVSDYDVNNIKARRLLAMSMTPGMLERYRCYDTGKKMWEKLVDRFEHRSDKIGRIHAARRVRTELWETKFDLNSDIELHRLVNLRTELIRYGGTMSDEEMVEVIIYSFPALQPEFESFRNVWHNPNGLPQLDDVIEMVKGVHARWTNSKRNTGKHRKPKTDGADKSNDSGAKPTWRKCYRCGAKGHLKKDCTAPDKSTGDVKSDEPKSAMYTQVKREDIAKSTQLEDGNLR